MPSFRMIFSIFLMFGFVAYAAVEGYYALEKNNILKWVYLGTFLLDFVIFFAGSFLTMKYRVPFAKQIKFIGNIWFISWANLFISFVLVDLFRIVNLIAKFYNFDEMLFFRKWFLFATLAVIFLMLVIGYIRFLLPMVTRLTLTSLNKPLQNKTLSIVAVSDLHLGVSFDKKWLKKFVLMINRENPDLVLIAGDISDNTSWPIIEQKMSEEFRQINSKLGVYGVSGNHDLMGSDHSEFERYLQNECQVNYLRDSAVLVDESFYIIGRDDSSRQSRKSLSGIVSCLDQSKPFILLDHQPNNLDDAQKNGVGLQISGHTHGGQFFPFTVGVHFLYENPFGYCRKGNTHYYVSSGLGLWGPQFRIGPRSELVVITFNY